MADRHFPVRPNLNQLKQQAKDLIRDIRRGASAAVAELQKHHPRNVEPAMRLIAERGGKLS